MHTRTLRVSADLDPAHQAVLNSLNLFKAGLLHLVAPNKFDMFFKVGVFWMFHKLKSLFNVLSISDYDTSACHRQLSMTFVPSLTKNMQTSHDSFIFQHVNRRLRHVSVRFCVSASLVSGNPGLVRGARPQAEPDNKCDKVICG